MVRVPWKQRVFHRAANEVLVRVEPKKDPFVWNRKEKKNSECKRKKKTSVGSLSIHNKQAL
jgi:hypothetical protein